MTPELWARIKPLFHAVLEVPFHQRDDFVSRACEGEPAELRRELERLLQAHGDAGSFIERSPAAPAAAAGLSGRTVGRYRIGRLIGIGGMGEVYAARDEDLGRDVALKVARATDGDATARLRREAQLASRLNHPNVCTIHEVGVVDGQPFIVMEFVEGPTLADRLAGGALPFDEALQTARQIAEALDEAHGRGIVHRDLKPANVKLRADGTVKVLDFGLAKPTSSPLDTSGETLEDRSAASPLTREGTVVGTAGYMAPEQLTGEVVDRRVDIWAFGCVVYEMVTGTRAFAGATASETVAAVMTTEPDWSRVPHAWLPLLRRCLERTPARRLRDIGDALPLVGDSADAQLAARRRWPWMVVAAGLVAVAAATGYTRTKSAPVLLTPQVRFDIQPPDGQIFKPFAFAPSPDGRSVAFVATDMKRERGSLWVYSLASGESRAVIDVGANAHRPFWAPDSRSVALYANGKLITVEIATGTAQTILVRAGGVASSGAWNTAGDIVFGLVTGDGNDGLLRIPAAGGVPMLVTRVDRTHGEVSHQGPFFLPDGRQFLYQSFGNDGSRDTYLGEVDLPPDAQRATPLFRVPSLLEYAQYAHSPDPRLGYVVSLSQGRKLLVQPLDLDRVAMVGEPVAVPGQPSSEQASRELAVDTHILTYRRLEQINGVPVWVDRSGRTEPALGGEALIGPDFPRLSPEGRRVALVVDANLWVYDLTGRLPLKLTIDGGAFAPLWTPDGRRLVYEKLGGGLRSIAADGSETASRPASPAGHFHPHAFAPDGQLLAVELSGALSHLVAMRFESAITAAPVVRASGLDADGGTALSPDGRWLAHTTRTNGRPEIMVEPYPGPGVPVRVSPNGGVEPVWAQDGRELYYLEGSRLMAVPVRLGTSFEPQRPVPLFDGEFVRNGQPPSYDVAADGRFLMIVPSSPTRAPISIILNWTETLLSARR